MNLQGDDQDNFKILRHPVLYLRLADAFTLLSFLIWEDQNKLDFPKKCKNTRIDVQTRMYIVRLYAVLDNELSEFEIFPYFLAT